MSKPILIVVVDIDVVFVKNMLGQKKFWVQIFLDTTFFGFKNLGPTFKV